jgi:LL-H family phage holin
MTELQPHIDTIVQALVGLLVVFVLGVISKLRVKIEAWLEARTSSTQREVLHRMANEAQALIEATMRSSEGQYKLQKAEAYVKDKLDQLGIQISLVEIRAAIEKAVQDYNQQKGVATDAGQK